MKTASPIKTSNPVLRVYPIKDRNVFLMMRFHDTRENESILRAIRSTLEDYDLNLLRADMKIHKEESLWEHVCSYMNASKWGIAVFEHIDSDDFNPNVSIEVGYMIAKKKRILLLKEKHLTKLPSDIAGRLYNEFDAHNIEESITTSVKKQLQDIGVAKFHGEKLLLYLSQSGTCRCAMAKIVTRQALLGRTLPFQLRICSIALLYEREHKTSEGARQAIQEEYGEDILKDHYVTKLRPVFIEDADVILPMDADLLHSLPANARTKAQLFKKFFTGEARDVHDPWPPTGGGAADRYRQCLADVRSTVEPASNIRKLLEALR